MELENTKPSVVDHNTVKFRDMKNCDMVSFSNGMISCDIYNGSQDTDDISWDRWKLAYTDICDRYALMKSLRQEKRSNPWHDDVIKLKHFPRYWPIVRGIHRSPGNFPHKGQWRGALMFSLICVWINAWVNYREANDLRRYHAHYDVIVTDDPWYHKAYVWAGPCTRQGYTKQWFKSMPRLP